MRTLADMTEEERAQCQGMWCVYETPAGEERAIYEKTQAGAPVSMLFEPGYGRFEAENENITPRPELSRAWQADGQPPLTQYWTIEQAADYAQLSTRTLHRRIADGSLTAYRSGRAIRLKPQDIDTLFTRVEPREMDEI